MASMAKVECILVLRAATKTSDESTQLRWLILYRETHSQSDLQTGHGKENDHADSHVGAAWVEVHMSYRLTVRLT